MEPLLKDTSLIRIPLYYGQFTWSLIDRNLYKAYFSKTDTSIMRTLIPVPLVFVIKKFHSIFSLILSSLNLRWVTAAFNNCLSFVYLIAKTSLSVTVEKTRTVNVDKLHTHVNSRLVDTSLSRTPRSKTRTATKFTAKKNYRRLTEKNCCYYGL